MTRRDAFLRWCQETWGAGAWYTLSPEMKEEIKREWEDWEDWLFQAEILPDIEMSGEDFYKHLKNLSSTKTRRVGEALYEAEKEIFS